MAGRVHLTTTSHRFHILPQESTGQTTGQTTGQPTGQPTDASCTAWTQDLPPQSVPEHPEQRLDTGDAAPQNLSPPALRGSDPGHPEQRFDTQDAAIQSLSPTRNYAKKSPQ